MTAARKARQQTIHERVQHDARLVVEEAVQRIEAAGLPVTGQLIMAYVKDVAMSHFLDAFERDYEAGKIVPGSRKKLCRWF